MSETAEFGKVNYNDWMGSDNESDAPSLPAAQGQGGQSKAAADPEDGFVQDRFEGLDGHMRLQLEKTYGGDDRFKLTKDFDVSFKDANKSKSHIPDVMLGALSKREQEDFISDKKLGSIKQRAKDTGGYESLEEGDVKWEHGIDLEIERANALNILSSIVPANEVFLTSSKSQNRLATSMAKQSGNMKDIDVLTGKGDASGTKKRAMHIKRFDPSNPNCQALVVKQQKKTEEEIKNKTKLKKPKTEKQMLLEEGRLQVLNKRNTNQTLQEQKDLLKENFINQVFEPGEGEAKSIQIQSSKWKNILDKNKTSEPAQEQTGGGFFLNFDDAPAAEPSETKAKKALTIPTKEEPLDPAEEAKRKAKQEKDEAKALAKLERQKEKREKKRKEREAQLQGERIPLDQLPARIQKRIEKRNRKKKELRAQKKEATHQKKVDYEKMDDEQIVNIYRQVYPERDEKNLQEYVYYQRIIHDAKFNRRNKNKNVKCEEVEDKSDSDGSD